MEDRTLENLMPKRIPRGWNETVWRDTFAALLGDGYEPDDDDAAMAAIASAAERLAGLASARDPRNAFGVPVDPH